MHATMHRRVFEFCSYINGPFAIALSMVVALLAASRAQAQSPDSLFAVPEVPEPPRLEDFLVDTPAVRALRMDSFLQRQPGDGEPTSEADGSLSVPRSHGAVRGIRLPRPKAAEYSGSPDQARTDDGRRSRRRVPGHIP